MLRSLLTVTVLAVGTAEEMELSRASLDGLGVDCRVVTAGGPDGAVPAGATPGELITGALDGVATPLVLLLLAGETVDLLVDVLETPPADGGGRPPVPLEPLSSPPGLVVQDPLALPGARLIPSAWRPSPGPWRLDRQVLPNGPIGPYAITNHRRPVAEDSPGAAWARAAADRRARHRGDRPATAEEAVLDAVLLAWAGEYDGALSSVRTLDRATNAQTVTAARIRVVAGLAGGRTGEADVGVEQWAAAAPNDPELAAWRMVATTVRAEPARLSHPGEGGPVPAPASASASEGWYLRVLAGHGATRWRTSEYDLNICLGYLRLWARTTSRPNEVTRAYIANETIAIWRRMGRSAEQLVETWPAGASSILGQHLGTGPLENQPFWLELAGAFSERYDPPIELLRRVDSMALRIPLSQALVWTMRAAALGHSEVSLLRTMASSRSLRPRDRVLAAALAMHHVGDTAAEALLGAATLECSIEDFAHLLPGLAQTAPGAVESFVRAAATTPERADALGRLAEQLAVGGPDPPRAAEGANRAQRRGQRRR